MIKRVGCLKAPVCILLAICELKNTRCGVLKVICHHFLNIYAKFVTFYAFLLDIVIIFGYMRN